MILLAKIKNTEVALRYKHDPQNICHYETKILVMGTIKNLTGRNPSKLGFPVEYSGYWESEFDRLRTYKDKHEKDILLSDCRTSRYDPVRTATLQSQKIARAKSIARGKVIVLERQHPDIQDERWVDDSKNTGS